MTPCTEARQFWSSLTNSIPAQIPARFSPDARNQIRELLDEAAEIAWAELRRIETEQTQNSTLTNILK